MIKVSDITTYLKCPRMCYFTNKGHDIIIEFSSGYIERIIFKELALTYDSAVWANEKLSFLKTELERISNEVRVIYPAELQSVSDETLNKSIAEISPFLERICTNLSTNSEFYMGEFIEDEPILRSIKFEITGSPDRLVKIGENLIPSIIKTGKMPENGVWQTDRLQLTAYSILVEEKYGYIIEKGFVEYARWGIVRPVVIKRNERRKVLQIKERIKKIHAGFMPEKPDDAPCQYCRFSGICDVKSTLASKFF
ncbi:MAG: CRISPR-associated protein Cas4 [Candidatus Methanoperedens sp.]|nr:CRISPR-associated protein Cas4 [Candidatus Methanoperedens sp.]